MSNKSTLFSHLFNKQAEIEQNLLDYGDYNTVRQHIFDRIQDSVQQSFPIENQKYKLTVDNLKYQGTDKYNPTEEKKAVLTGGDVNRRLTGKYSLIDKETGKKIDQSGQVTLLNVPYLTDRGEFIRRGVRYVIPKQFRVNPGVYTRIADNGMIEAAYNIKPGTGHNFKIEFDPDKTAFYYKMGGRRIPLVYLLESMGVDSDRIQQTLGKGLYDVNARIRPSVQARSWVSQLNTPEKQAAEGDPVPGVYSHFANMAVDPDTTQRTLGQPYTNITPDVLLRSAEKILNVYHDKEDTDDRDSLAYQSVHDFADMVSEKIKRDQNRVLRNALWKMTHKGSLKNLPSGVLNKHLDHLFTVSGLAQGLEEVNPLDSYSQNMRIVKIGEGGIPTVQQAPLEARAVQPSYAGYIDPVRGPESQKTGLDMYFAENVRRGKKDNLLYTQFLNPSTGEREWVNTKDASNRIIAFPEYLTTDQEYVPAIIRGDKMGYVRKENVNYVIPSGDEMFSTGANMAPFKSGIKGMRLLMACLHPDTKIFIQRHDGQIFYDTVSTYEYREGDKVRSIGDDYKTDWKEVRGLHKNYDKNPMVEVTLKSGRKLKTTVNHKWVTMGEDGALQQILAEDLTIGTPIPRETRLLFNKTPEQTIHIPKGVANNCHTSISFKTTYDVGYLLGVYLAEGSLSKNGSTIELAIDNNDMRTRICNVLTDMGIVHRVVNNGTVDHKKVRIHYKAFHQWLEANFKIGSYNKKLPGWVFTCPESFREGIISGYFDGDGCIYDKRGRGRIEAGSRSKDLIEDLMLLCTSLGIDTTIREEEINYNDVVAPFYRILLRAEHVHKFPGFINDRKKAKFKKLQHWSGKKSAYWIPMYTNLADLVRKVSKRGENFRQKIYTNQHTKNSLRERFTAKEIPWIGSSIIWDRVVKIEEMPPVPITYDLDVNDAVYMTGSTIVVHNSKYPRQSLPLVKNEAPLVDTVIKNTDGMDTSIFKKLGQYSGAKFSPVDGKIKSVYKDHITVTDKEGKDHRVSLYNNLPLARKTVLNNIAKVKAGQEVSKGDLLAPSNFTDDEGYAAPGSNLNVAYTNYKGSTYEDAVVLSESGAEKLSHTALYPVSMENEPDLVRDLRKFRTLFPSKFSDTQLKKLDDKGVIKVGQKVNYGDPLIVGVKERTPELSSLGRTVSLDETETWDHHTPGIVTDIAETDKGYKVFVRTDQKLKEADKVAIRAGGKGVTAKIIPDDKMLKDEKGNPIDLIISRLTIPSRTNSSQMIEAALGKVADKTGKRYEVPGFMEEPLYQYAMDEAKKHNVKINEDLIDPETGKKIPDIFVGKLYAMKTQQTSESKGKSRSTDFYTAEGAPGRGGSSGSKHMGSMEYEALLAHHAPEILKDTKLIKGQENPEFWREVKAGRIPSMPQSPMVYEKFKDLIQAAGITYEEGETSDSIFAMTNEQASKLTGNRKLKHAKTFDKNTLTPINSGLFDPEHTASMDKGDRWSYFETPEPMLNPIMEDPVKKLLGLTGKEFEKIVSGEEEYKGSKGGYALRHMLEDLDLDNEERKAKDTIKNGPKSRIDQAVKKFKVIKSMKQHGNKPEDFMMTRVPVVPPKHRPIQKMKDITLVADLNHLYRELFHAMEDYKEVKEVDVPEDVKNNARHTMYRAYQDLVGITSPLKPKLKEANVGGIISQLFGKTSGKASLVKRKLIESNVDLAGLGVAAPNPALKLNEVGLPINQAWGLYEPFIIQHLVRNNVPAMQAAKAVENRDRMAFSALQRVIKQRPVIINRAPSLHKYSMMAMWPRLAKGDHIQVSPQITEPLNLDFDGDSILTSVMITIEKDKIKEYLKNPKANNLQWNIPDVYLKQFTNKCECKHPEKENMQSRDTGVATVGLDIQIEDFPRLKDTETLKSENITEWDVPEGIYIKAYDRDTGEKGIYPVTKFSEHRNIPMYDVVTGSRGMYPETVTVSEDNSLIVYDKKTGDIVTGKPEESEKLMTPSFKDTLVEDEDQLIKYLRIGKQVPAGYDIGRFIGAMIGDGWVDMKNQVRIYSDYDEIHTTLLNISNNLLPTKKYGQTFEYATQRHGSEVMHRTAFHLTKEAAVDLKNLVGSGATEKKIPVPSLKASKAHMRGILSGLLSTDGQCSYRKVKGRKSMVKGVRYDTTSIKLKDSFVTLCRKLGIRTSVTPYTGTATGNQAYSINLSLVDFHKFCRTHTDFTLFNSERQEVLNKILTDMDAPGQQSARLDLVPLPDTSYDLLKILRPFTDLKTEMLCGYRKKGFLPRKTASQFVEAWKEVDREELREYDTEAFRRWIKIVEDDTVTWKQITKITPIGTRTCYDITVPGPYTFATGTGLIVQDTLSYSVPVSDAAVKAAVDKMMPEKNLISGRKGQPHFVPEQEYAEGLYYASKEPRTQKPVKFASVNEMKQAYNKGLISVDTPVIIG